jgi:hypothetical protein
MEEEKTRKEGAIRQIGECELAPREPLSHLGVGRLPRGAPF